MGTILESVPTASIGYLEFCIVLLGQWSNDQLEGTFGYVWDETRVGKRILYKPASPWMLWQTTRLALTPPQLSIDGDRAL